MGINLHVICVAYNRVIPLRILCDCFLVQTDSNWNLHIIYDGPVPEEVQKIFDIYAKEKRINFYRSEKRLGNHGHPNRKQLLDKLVANPEDYILMTNDDNYYVPEFVKYVLKRCDSSVGIVLFNTVHSYFNYQVQESKLRIGDIDMGAFIVKCSIAKNVGFNHIEHIADGYYAEECGKYCKDNNYKIIHIQKPIFIHN